MDLNFVFVFVFDLDFDSDFDFIFADDVCVCTEFELAPTRIDPFGGGLIVLIVLIPVRVSLKVTLLWDKLERLYRLCCVNISLQTDFVMRNLLFLTGHCFQFTPHTDRLQLQTTQLKLWPWLTREDKTRLLAIKKNNTREFESQSKQTKKT